MPAMRHAGTDIDSQKEDELDYLKKQNQKRPREGCQDPQRILRFAIRKVGTPTLRVTCAKRKTSHPSLM